MQRSSSNYLLNTAAGPRAFFAVLLHHLLDLKPTNHRYSFDARCSRRSGDYPRLHWNVPSKFQLCCLDLLIFSLQLLLATISYGTSVHYATDILLPQPPESVPPLMQKDSSDLYSTQPTPSYHTNVPIVIDLRLSSIATHFQRSRGPANESFLPLPNTSPFNFSARRTFLRPGRSRQIERRTSGAATARDREMRMPGAMDTTQDR